MASTKIVWVGRVISVLVSLLFLFSAVLKVMDGPEVLKSFQHLGLPVSMRIPLAILEITCVVIYLIPQTAVVGAILLTGYVGGTIVTAWRSGDPFYMQIALGILIWLGLYLRESRLKALIPLRTQ
ncbi:MAG TPA: DoxX family protein [Thermoanaerobaculia bacterium]